MAQSITLIGATYPDVPSILLPKSTSGRAQFDDTTIASNAASASDIASGKLAWVNGSLLTGTGSGGGRGLEYETGTYTPTSDIAQPTISFANTHTIRPHYVMIVDTTEATPTANSAYMWAIINWYDLFGTGIRISDSQINYARTLYIYKTSGNFTTAGNNISFLDGTINTSMVYYLTEATFTPYLGGTSRYFRANKTYKWIAVWKP